LAYAFISLLDRGLFILHELFSRRSPADDEPGAKDAVDGCQGNQPQGIPGEQRQYWKVPGAFDQRTEPTQKSNESGEGEQDGEP
jgi:hypothetical protein